MESFLQLDAAALGQIRKTSEDPPRVSIYDAIQAVTGQSDSRKIYSRLKEAFPEVVTNFPNLFQFPGAGQRLTPVADARGIVEIIMLLPGRVAARFRKEAASVLVRLLGGDLSLVDELAEIHLAQQSLPENHPARLFGQTVESERLKRAREEELFTETMGRIKKARILAVKDVLTTAFAALEAVGLRADDRDRARAGDMIRTATFEECSSAEPEPEDAEICIRGVLTSKGLRGGGLDCSVGKLAKRLFLQDNPAYVFAKKQIFANGQVAQANVWRSSMVPYIERAMEQLT